MGEQDMHAIMVRPLPAGCRLTVRFQFLGRILTAILNMLAGGL
jgi:hypothetical protein